MWFEQMHAGWQVALEPQRQLLTDLEDRLGALTNLAPARDLVMAAFIDDPARTRVLIVGQDPYPTEGVAVGRAFAVAHAPAPASLRNILKELDSDLGVNFGESGPPLDLAGWQSQGVLLLNRHLTTLSGEAGAHIGEGWTEFTDAAIAQLLLINPSLVLVLWGNQAGTLRESLAQQLAASRATIITGVHPSPLSAHRGFFGSKPFTAINAALQKQGFEQIDWRV
jgi:uracil-DNA glycosylase